MDIEDLLADDGQFKDDELDDLDVDEAALLGSSDEDEIDEDPAFGRNDSIAKASTSYHFGSSTAKKPKYDTFKDTGTDNDVLEVDVSAEADDELEDFSPESTKDVGTPDPPKAVSQYKDNLISVKLLPESSMSSRETKETSFKQEIVEYEDETTEAIRSVDASSENFEESDDERFDAGAGRERFKSERSNISIHMSLKNKVDIPDSLDSVLTQEETLKVNAFLENQQRRKMFNRSKGQFRGKIQQQLPSKIQQLPRVNTSSDVIRIERASPVKAPTKIHINPHFRPDPNSALAALHATQSFPQNVNTGIVNTSNYNDAHQPNYAYNNAVCPFPENERFSQALTQRPPPLISGAIASVGTYQHHTLLPPNLQPPAPSAMLPPPPNYLHSNPPNDYAAPMTSVMQSQHHLNQPTIPNVWIQPPVSIAPHPILEAPPGYSYPNTVGFNTHVDNYGLNNYQTPVHQQNDILPPHNVYHSNPPNSPWFQEQRIPAPAPVKQHQMSNQPRTFSQNVNVRPHSAPTAINENKYQNTGLCYMQQASKPTDQKRFSQLQVHSRKLVKRSANIAYGNQMGKKYRFDDNQRKASNSGVKTNYNIKQIPLIENLPVIKPQQQKPQPPVIEDEDEETREYRKKVEEQKKKREAFLKHKEERRKLMAVKRLEELHKRNDTGIKSVPMEPKPHVTNVALAVQGSNKKIISLKGPQHANMPPKGNVLTQNQPSSVQNAGLQRSNTNVQKSVPFQSSKLDLRNKITAPGKVNVNRNIANKTVVNTGKITLVSKKFSAAPQLSGKTPRANTVINAGGALNTKASGNVKKSAMNLSHRFKVPYSVQRPVNQKNQRMNVMQFRGGHFPGERFPRPQMPSNFPAQEPLFPQFQMHMMRRPQFQDQRFNVHPGNNSGMPLLQFPDERIKHFPERPSVMDQLPHNFNPRFQGHKPQEFLMDRARMPPPRFCPPQVYSQGPAHHPGIKVPPPRFHGSMNRKVGRFSQGMNTSNKFRGNQFIPSSPVLQSAPPANDRGKATLTESVIVKKEPSNTDNPVVSSSKMRTQDLRNGPKTIIVSNLSSSTTEGQLRMLSTAIGPIEEINHMACERKATISFRNSNHASQFQSKYQRYMLDLSLIEVTLQSP